jgi:PPOX class probable F420-dependent enzyme
MTVEIPDSHVDLFHKRALAHLATLMPDGSPQVTPLWVEYDGGYVLINTAKGRQKDRNMRHRREVALDIVDPDNPFHYLVIRGTVVDITEEGAEEHADKLTRMYTGAPRLAPYTPDEVRVIYKIAPEHVTAFG